MALPGSTWLCRPPPGSAWSCSSQRNQQTPADSGKISGASRAGRISRPQQNQQNQRTLIWLSILARTLALVQSLSLDSRMASSLWPYPPTIDRSGPRQNQRSQQSRQSQRTPAESAESADLDLAVHPCENLGACAVLESGQQDGLVALAIAADH